MGFDALCDRLEVSPQIAAEVDDMAMMRLLAREGAGLAVIPPIVVKDEIKSGELIEAHVLDDLVETFYSVTTRRRFPNQFMSLLTK
jgi:LysR family transcriptional activator of nhaA